MNIKICGVCSVADAKIVAGVAADYMGVILAPGRVRSRSVEQAGAVYECAPAARRVGVFANQRVPDICDAAGVLQLDVVQLHGAENARFVEEVRSMFTGAVWKAVELRHQDDLKKAVADYGDVVHGILLDSGKGGSGTRFDWSLATDARAIIPHHIQLIVAGGLNADNVAEVSSLLQPDVVDVASGVEAETGVKSREKCEAFVRSARA